MLNRFLIGFKSGDLAGITCIFAPIEYTYRPTIPASTTALKLDDMQLYYSFASYLD
jgi:hypothetical protein